MYSCGVIDQSSLSSLGRSVRTELDRLALLLSQPVEYVALQKLYAEPSRRFDGMTVLVDGTEWNPGSGAGVYTYYGGAWKKLG